MKAGFRLGGKQGKAKLEQYAKWLERDQPNTVASLREGLDEMFTIDIPGLPPMLKRCFETTNMIDNSHSAARQKIHRVTNWQSGEMAVRCTASALVSSSKNFRRVMGYKDLWMLKSNLQHKDQNKPIAEKV
jgi:transposase-like protein